MSRGMIMLMEQAGANETEKVTHNINHLADQTRAIRRDHLTTTFRTATDAPGGGSPYSFTIRRSERSRKGRSALPMRGRRRGERKRRAHGGIETSHASVQEQQGQLEAPTATAPMAAMGGMFAPWLVPWFVPWGGEHQQASPTEPPPSSRRTRSEF